MRVWDQGACRRRTRVLGQGIDWSLQHLGWVSYIPNASAPAEERGREMYAKVRFLNNRAA